MTTQVNIVVRIKQMIYTGYYLTAPGLRIFECRWNLSRERRRNQILVIKKPVFHQYLFINNWYFDIERHRNTYLQGKGRWVVVRQVGPPKMKRKLKGLIVLQKKWWKITWRIIVSQDFDVCGSTIIMSPRRWRLSVEARARLLAARAETRTEKEGTLFFVMCVFSLSSIWSSWFK